MANASTLTESNPARILMIGNNGSGKTGSLLSLLLAGFKVRLLDVDNGAELLINMCRAHPERERLLANLDIETHQDQYVEASGKAFPKLPLTGFSGAMKCLTDWPGLGKPTTWGTDTVLVLDSLTFLGRYIMNHVLNLNGRLVTGKKEIQDWGQAMDMQEQVCAMITASSIKCHVIVMAHLTYVQPEGEVQQFAYPSALGSKLPPVIGSYFNSTLYVGPKGVGPNKSRAIFTKSQGLVITKTSAPGLVADDYPLETGLADFFRDIGSDLKS